MKELKLAIFDLAGTTVLDKNGVAQCLQKALGQNGLSITFEDANEVMGIPKPIAIEALLKKYRKTGNVSNVHQEFMGLMQSYYESSDEVVEIPGAASAFAELREMGFKIALDTGFDRKTTDILLSRMPWTGLIDDSITSDEVAQGRPFPEMIFELARRAEVKPKAVMKVGDTPSDLQEGESAGVGLNLGVLSGAHTREQLEVYAHDALISSVADLPSFLRKRYKHEE